jgi:hypothetical protein
MWVEGGAKYLDLRFYAPGGMVRGQVYRDDIEADRGLTASSLWKALAVDGCHRPQNPLFRFVDGKLCGHDVASGAGLHFNKTEGLAVPSNQVNISLKLRSLPSPGDKDVTESAEMKEGFFFAPEPGGKVRYCTCRLAVETPCQGVDTAQQAQLEGDAVI